jgi:hypothetical protein
MHRLCYMGVDSSNERPQNTKEKGQKNLFPIVEATNRENFTANSAKMEIRDPTSPCIGSGPDSIRFSYPGSGSGYKEAEMANIIRENEDIECFEELGFLSDGLESFLELGSLSWRHTKR